MDQNPYLNSLAQHQQAALHPNYALGMNAIYLQQLGSLGSRAGLLGGLGAGLANAMRTPQQSKLDRARAYLKEAAKRHPEWKVGKADEDWGF